MGKSWFPARSIRSMAADAYGWADERLGIAGLIARAREKTVPQHRHAFWYYWGGLALLFFGVQMVTGVLLLLYYRPGTQAHDSVSEITMQTEFGWFIRSVHSWSANLMVLAILVHMFSVFFMKAYRKPREFQWWSGLGLLGMTFVFGFSGYLLPMDDLAYFATQVGLKIPEVVPVVGPFLSELIRGGPEVTSYTNQRFFTLHVVVLPLFFLAILGFHLWLVQKHGNAIPPSEEAKPESERRKVPFFPNFFSKDLASWLIAFNALVIAAAFYPWPLGPKADPLAPAPAGIHPEWYFMGQFEALKVVGRILPGTDGELAVIGAFGLGGLVWALIPLYDTARERRGRARVVVWIGILALAGLVALTVAGYVEAWMQRGA